MRETLVTPKSASLRRKRKSERAKAPTRSAVTPTGISLWLPIVATIGAELLGKYAQKIAQWVACAHSEIVLQHECYDHTKAEALSIGSLIITVIVIGGAATTAHAGKVCDRDAALTVVGALVVGLFALLDASSQGAGFPQWEFLRVPLYYLFISVLLFAVPLVCTPGPQHGLAHAVSLYLRLAVAVLVGALFGYSAQIAGCLYWKGLAFGECNGGIFIVAPSATAMAVGAWTLALIDPFLRNEVWRETVNRRRIWFVFYGLGAVALSGGYGALLHNHGGEAESAAKAAFVFIGLSLPALAAIVLLFVFRLPAALSWRSIAATALAGGVMAAATSSGVVFLRPVSAVPPSDQVVPFVVAHILAAVATVLTVFSTHKLLDFWQGFSARNADRGYAESDSKR